MALTDLQISLILYMRDEVGMEEDAIIASMLQIKEEDQQMEMVEFLMNNPKATREDVLEKAVEIKKQNTL